MLTIKKYLLFVFLLENIMVQTSLLGAFTNPLFYLFLGLGVICAFDGNLWSGTAIKKFGWAYSLMALYIVYEFTVGAEYISQKTLIYMIAKIVTFVIIITGVYYNEEFYRGKAIKWLIITMSFFLLYGLATGESAQSTGRMMAGYTNENTAGGMGALIVGMVVFSIRDKKWTTLPVVCLLAGMFGVLAGGSRAGFLMLGLMVFLRYGFNVKTVGMGMAVVVLGLYILPAVGIETVGIQRMIDTYNGIEGTNRDIEREAAKWMIAQKPWTGWGYEATNQGYALILTVLPPHNGYLEILKQMGYPCAIVYFLVIATTILKGLREIRKHHVAIDLYMALALMLMVKAAYESLFIGVHEFETNIIYYALALVSARSYTLKEQ